MKSKLHVKRLVLRMSDYPAPGTLKGEIEFSDGENKLELLLTDEQSRRLMVSVADFMSESANEIADGIRQAFSTPPSGSM